MGKINEKILAEAKNFILGLLENKLPEGVLFHSKDHTLDVLKNVVIIGNNSLVSQDDINVLQIAALFHDIGYVVDYQNHERESVIIARNFLNKRNIDKDVIDIICNTIMATKIPQNPINIYESILCDADLMHLTYSDYFKNIELMRIEWQKIGKAQLSELEFHKGSLNFIKQHKYHTKYGKEILNPLKSKIEKKIINRISKLEL